MKNPIVWFNRDKSESNTYGKKIKSFEVLDLDTLRQKPVLWHVLQQRMGKQHLAKALYLKDWETTESILGFVPQNHPLQNLPLSSRESYTYPLK